MTSARPRHTRAVDREVVRWRNGQGTTQVVAETDLWRVSIADEPTRSTFSVIEGYDRLLMPTGSVTMEMSGPPYETSGEVQSTGEVHRVAPPRQVFAFPGEWAPSCRAADRTRALNVMGRRGRVEMSLRIADVTAPVDVDAVRIYVDLDTEDAVIVSPGDDTTPDWAGECAVVSIRTR
ncbi:HutD family protein [Rhodococcus sp. NPDC003348]